ncbi:SDR family NAD(P)-dependent oxidoreductase [Pseudidiomarina terrestris]|uniref:SDR family NAD(P)-dependent oxidoreductase n=1 Tax=Pseudidiomarina terrestris TaxID=2820060 RepID=A0AAW7QVF8_9GAMM|nr:MULTISPECIES: SDR family NAD(P)-dependent oxidoreductase [unclassified Pseudidiomarina]MDN7124196.1 SDR family NAD(P)-dependent oxidoreductase [Pseudidiomarina sp. 1APP75-32.1]MDN7135299.1 SDR family NAD(P)-dependent oxidoreductase [Pseudidiomarina sp. 1ASP75-5]MDN7138642.1 SDR family NAD(P)-dependent oxidoreductase [Pseudidiomarina sp. 1ASP75-14]MEA3586931.1 SDR family NAD(P)-dependent oxidoreductase [Pseudidiomarina sp. 1APP75-27a]
MNILITGATSGIGKQLACDYAKAGHHIVACGRNEQALAELEQRFPDAIAGQQLDISDKDTTIQNLRGYTDIDLVILVAGVCEYLDIDNFDADLFARVFNINVVGTMRCVEALLPNLKAGSKLVIVGSTARLLPFTRAEAYGGSKAAIHYITRSLQVDLEERGIKVLSVSPGFVETPMTEQNDFEMPMQVSVEYASDFIRRGIDKNRLDITFPRTFGWFLKFASRLPQSWQLALSRRFKQAT